MMEYSREGALPREKIGKICMHCLKEDKNIKPIKIEGMGYGSIFDSTTTQIDLCDDCKVLKPTEWWNLKNVEDHRVTSDDVVDPEADFEDYVFYKIEFEEEIMKFINTFPLAGQELFFNHYDREYYMQPQDWIDYKLNKLPYDKCKEYHLYAPDEIDAYQRRFPVCGNVYLKKYGDGSEATYCKVFSSVSGRADGTCGQTCTRCFGCTHFNLRKGKMDFVDVVEDFYKREIESTERTIELQWDYLKKLRKREVNPDEVY